jgi:hypothetical protein
MVIEKSNVSGLGKKEEVSGFGGLWEKEEKVKWFLGRGVGWWGRYKWLFKVGFTK